MADETSNEQNDGADAGGDAGANTNPITPEANPSDPNTEKTLETGFDGDADGTGTHRVTHSEEGPRGFDTAADGTVMIPPGGTAMVTLTADEEKRLNKFGIFEIDKADAKTSTKATGAKAPAAKPRTRGGRR